MYLELIVIVLPAKEIQCRVWEEACHSRRQGRLLWGLTRQRAQPKYRLRGIKLKGVWWKGRRLVCLRRAENDPASEASRSREEIKAEGPLTFAFSEGTTTPKHVVF